jgi:hypothetical protein
MEKNADTETYLQRISEKHGIMVCPKCFGEWSGD